MRNMSRTEKQTKAYTASVEILNKREQLQDLGLDGRIILKSTLKKQEGGVWI
jgi:hypothetical protein